MEIGLLYSRIRRDEKLLLSELRDRGHDVQKIDVRDTMFGVGAAGGEGFNADDTENETSDAGDDTEEATDAMSALAGCDVVLDRCLATSRSVYTTRFAEAYDVPVVNDPATARVCLEHKATLGHYEHKVFYVQQFVAKPGRDLRVLVCGTEPVAAMSRSGDHWLTNAKQGAETAAFELDDRAAELATAAAEAVGGGLLGVDLMEVGAAEDADVADADADAADADADAADADADAADADTDTETESRYTVHEVNHTVEFKALNDAVDRDVPATVVDWLEATHGAETDDTSGTDDTEQVIAE